MRIDDSRKRPGIKIPVKGIHLFNTKALVKGKEKNGIMNKVVLFLADGFEEIEGLTVVDILRRDGIELETVSIMGRKEIHGSHDITVLADTTFEEAKFDDVTMFVLPGGGIGTINLKKYEPLKTLIKKAYEDGKYVAAICAAPTFLGEIGILKDKKACCYGGMESGLMCKTVSFDDVTVDGNVITSRGMGTALTFSLKLLEILSGEEAADKMARMIMLEK